MIRLDGSIGEGGGQILRSALTLSIITSQPFHITNIRSKRPNPGLRAQHLTSVLAAQAISNATVDGAVLGSKEIIFRPGNVSPGKYSFQMETAGSTNLVLQTIYLPLALKPLSSEVVLKGGTHVPYSPSFHFLERQWVPFLRRIGINLELHLSRAGLFPRGGGRIHAKIDPCKLIRNLRLVRRSCLVRIRPFIIASGLPAEVVQHIRNTFESRLAVFQSIERIETQMLPATDRGALLYLEAVFRETQMAVESLIGKGNTLEQTVGDLVARLEALIRSHATIDTNSADQIMLPLSLAGESELVVSHLTGHIETIREVICRFLPAQIFFHPYEGAVKIQILGIGLHN